MKSLTILFFLITFFANAQKPFAVVELFTSEGCSSCPPADALVSKIGAISEKEGKNIFFLSYHVDYWNRLGWKDPYSKYQYTLRQENYSRVLAGKEVYTPQIIVNGIQGFTGSKEATLNESIKEALATPAKLIVSAQKDSVKNDTLYLEYKISKADPNYVIRLAVTEDDLNSVVKRGENQGKNLHHDYVVRIFTTIDNPVVSGKAKISLKGNRLSSKNRLIVFVQHKQTMRILGAEKVNLEPGK